MIEKHGLSVQVGQRSPLIGWSDFLGGASTSGIEVLLVTAHMISMVTDVTNPGIPRSCALHPSALVLEIHDSEATISSSHRPSRKWLCRYLPLLTRRRVGKSLSNRLLCCCYVYIMDKEQIVTVPVLHQGRAHQIFQ
jgi:hypothetical protein